MPKIRVYHIRTLLWTYLVWAVLSLLFAFRCCAVVKCSLIRMPIYWALSHILPLMFFLPSEIHAFGMWLPACAVLPALLLVAGLLVNKWWACFLIIIGMSIWFFVAMCLMLMSA